MPLKIAIKKALAPAEKALVGECLSAQLENKNSGELCSVNCCAGVLIPGGGQNLSPHHPFYDTSALLFNLTLGANDAGDFFPVDVKTL